MSDLMREEFEIWWAANMNIQEMDLYRLNFPMQKPDFVQPYACHETQRSWLAWQASRECLVIELPEDFEFHDPHEAGMAIRACREAVNAAGVKTK